MNLVLIETPDVDEKTLHLVLFIQQTFLNKNWIFLYGQTEIHVLLQGKLEGKIIQNFFFYKMSELEFFFFYLNLIWSICSSLLSPDDKGEGEMIVSLCRYLEQNVS